jgi:CheY-like chemotaxis protein
MRDTTGEEPAGLCVLVALPHPAEAERFATVLRRARYIAEIASDGPTALDRARLCQPEVIILDLALAGGGPGLTKALLRDAAWRRPLLVVIADGEAADAGADLVVPKPASASLLVGVLSRFAEVVGEHRGFDPMI